MPKITAHDDVKSFRLMFETIVTREGWDRNEWPRLLAPLLTGEAQRTYFSIDVEVSGCYDELKREILARV